MSSAIKPPGGSGGAPPAGVGEAGAPRALDSGALDSGALDSGALDSATDVSRGEAFRGELSKAAETEGSKSSGATQRAGTENVGASRAELLRGLAEELRTGQVGSEQAVDRLVERALSSGTARGLPPARRAELETLLRTALAEDPTLAAMQGDLSRGR